MNRRRQFLRSVASVALSAFTLMTSTHVGGAQTAESACHGNQQIRKVAELLFGRDIGRRLGVTDSDWTRIVARELTPRFSDGLTVTDSLGQWRDRDSGRIVREPGKHVEIVLPGNTDDDAKLDDIATAYKHNFDQPSVAIIVRSACVSF